jgi:hypothetical protein
MADNTVLLRADDDPGTVKRDIANGTITPGDMIELGGLNTAGASEERNFTRVSTDAAGGPFYTALVYTTAGREKSDDYEAGDELRYLPLETGDEFDGFVFDGGNAGGAGTDLSANANISVGDKLVTYSGAGQDGTLRAYDADDTGAIVGVAVEAVDNSGGTDPARIEVEAV